MLNYIRKLFGLCPHDYKIIRVDNYMEGGLFPIKMSRIYKLCSKCNHISTGYIEGHWQIEDFSGH